MLGAGLWADRGQAPRTGLPAPLSPGVCRRAGPGRRLRALLVRGSQPCAPCSSSSTTPPAGAMHLQFVAVGVDLRLLQRDPAVSGATRQARSRSTPALRRLSGQQAQRGCHGDGMTQFSPRPREGAQHRDHLRQLQPGQGSRRERAANKTLQDRLVKELRLAGVSTIGGRQRLPAQLHGRLQRPLRQGAVQRQGPSSAHVAARSAGRSLYLAGGADTVAVTHPPVRPHPLHDRTVRVRSGRDRPPGRTVVDYPPMAGWRSAIKGRSMPYRTFDSLRPRHASCRAWRTSGWVACSL